MGHVTVLKPGKVPVMPPHAWFGRCYCCGAEIRVDSATEHIGPPLPPHVRLECSDQPLKNPVKDGYDSDEQILVSCPTIGCPKKIVCIRKAI